MSIKPRLTQPQQFVQNDLMAGCYIPQFKGMYVQMSNGRTISQETFKALLREKVIKMGTAPPQQHGAKPVKAWIYAEPGDPEGGKMGDEEPVDATLDAASHEKWLESWVTKFAALSSVPEITRRRQQIKSLITQFAKDATGNQRA